MKISFIQLMMITLIVSISYAHKSFGQESLKERATISIKNGSIKSVLQEIEKQVDVTFSYQKEVISISEKVTIEVKNETIEEILKKVLVPRNISYQVLRSNQIILTRNPRLGVEENILNDPSANKKNDVTITDITIKGKVKALDNNEILPGVSVALKGTNKGTTTNGNGEFTINVPSNKAVLVFSFVGYLTQEIPVNNNSQIEVSLRIDSKALDEVVVVGYGEIRKSDLTGSVSQLKVAQVSDKPITSVEQLLQGRVSGVQIQSSNGAPGAGLSFLIRGGNSTSNNQPLIVLDGYPIDAGNGDLSSGGNNQAVVTPPTNPLANLNPNEIENIEILKDASSTAIYGSRGANGVVLITTKRGKKGADRVEFNYRTDFSDVRNKLNVLNSNDFLNFANEAATNSGVARPYADTTVTRLSRINSNWQNEIFRQAISHDYQLGLSGGEGRTNYAIIGNYSQMDGTVKNSNFTRGGLRVNLDREVSNRLKIGMNVNLSKSNSQLGVNGIPTGLNSSNVINSALMSLPFSQAYNASGDIDQTIDANPLTLINILKDVYSNTLLFSNLTANLKIDNYFSIKANLGGNNSQSTRQTYYPRGTFVGTSSNGYAYQNQDSRFNYLGEITLSYNRKFANSNINAVAGHTYQKWFADGLATSASGFPNDNLGYYSFQSAQANGQTFTSHQEWSLASFLGRVNYSLMDKYLFTLTGRSDGASRLAQGNKWAFFPSVAFGWNIHNESFMKSLKWVETWKLRASYGVSGNQTVAIGATQQFLTSDAAVIGGSLSRGYIVNNIANPLLGWENTKQINIGTELGFMKNRLHIEVNIYQKNTKNLLINLPIASSTGFSSYVTNAGEVENKGLEIDVLARLLDKDLKWTFSGNISFNRNKMVDMGPLGADGIIFGQTFLGSGGLLSQPIHATKLGYPIGSFYGYKIDGIYQNNEQVANGPEKTSAKPGDFKFVDTNGDGVITAADRTIIGNPNPNYIFGFTNDFSYKGFSLSIFFQGSIGNQIVNLNRYRQDALTGNVFNVSQAAYDGRWTGEGTSNYYPRARWTGGYFNTRFADFIIEDGSFVRLKNITASYNIPLGKFKAVKSAKVFVTATNLLTFTKYTGYDPEVNANYNNPLSPGVDNGSYPQVKTVSFGVNLKF